ADELTPRLHVVGCVLQVLLEEALRLLRPASVHEEGSAGDRRRRRTPGARRDEQSTSEQDPAEQHAMEQGAAEQGAQPPRGDGPPGGTGRAEGAPHERTLPHRWGAPPSPRPPTLQRARACAGTSRWVPAHEPAFGRRARTSAAVEESPRRRRMGQFDELQTIGVVGAGQMGVGIAQLVIEAATEREELKLELFRQLDASTPPETLLASNTSSISITRIAAATRRADRVGGLHFMNPVPVMQLVEVVRGLQTSSETLAQLTALAHRVGKQTVASEDRPGFIINRVLIPFLNEACLALSEGVASVADIDAGIRLGL